MIPDVGLPDRTHPPAIPAVQPGPVAAERAAGRPARPWSASEFASAPGAAEPAMELPGTRGEILDRPGGAVRPAWEPGRSCEHPDRRPSSKGVEARHRTRGLGAEGSTRHEEGRGPARPVDREALIARYGHLVKYVVGRLGAVVPGVFDHEDAMQVGAMGLLRAIDAYRPEAAASFESYAIVRIRGAILDAVRALDVIGRAGREAARSIGAAITDLQAELGRGPTETEIAKRLGLSVERYRERLTSASLTTISLDALDRPDDDEGSSPLDTAVDLDSPDPEEAALRRSEIETLAREIARLPERQRTILGLYYQDGLTFREIGNLLGVTESRICQIHTEAVLVLRARLLGSEAAGIGRRQRGRNGR